MFYYIIVILSEAKNLLVIRFFSPSGFRMTCDVTVFNAFVLIADGDK
jgi:hypothetical protein